MNEFVSLSRGENFSPSIYSLLGRVNDSLDEGRCPSIDVPFEGPPRGPWSEGCSNSSCVIIATRIQVNRILKNMKLFKIECINNGNKDRLTKRKKLNYKIPLEYVPYFC